MGKRTRSDQTETVRAHLGNIRSDSLEVISREFGIRARGMEIVGKRTQQQSRNFESNLLYNGLSISESQKNIRAYSQLNPLTPIHPSDLSPKFLKRSAGL